MSTQSDIAVIRAIMTRLDANRASKFSYTDPAFDNDQIEGVSAFDVNSEQNIPLEGYTNFNETVRGKGVRTQGASLPRMGLNHFFGRTSYNLNKLIQKLSLWMDIDIAARAHNAAEYDPEAPYKTNDVCYSIETLSGVKTVTYYVRSSQTPTTIKGIPVTNGNHWTEVIDKKSGLHHKYAIADLTTGYDTTKWYPVVTPLQAFDATTDGTKDPAIQVSIEVLCNGPVAGFVNNQLAELTVMSKFTGFAASSTDIVLNDSVIDKVTGTDNTSSSLAPIGYTKLPFGRQAVVWLKGGSKYALWNSFGSSFTIYSGAYNNALDQAIAPADAIPFSVTNGSVRADIIGKLNGVAPGAAGLAVLRLQSLSNADPLMSGDPEPGISEIPSREDHVHPHDSSKANLVSPAFTGSPTSESDPDLGALTRQLATAEFVKKSIDFYAGSGSADGNIGYNFTNRQAEVDITGWSTYKDVPAIGNVAAPIDGSGGTPTAVSISRITVNALAGKGSLRLTKSALNGQGEGMSYNFTIDPGNLGLEAQVSLLCRGSSGYADGDVGAYIYDVTNNVLIPTSVTSIPKTDTVNGNKFAFLFLPNRTSGSYRLIFNVQTQSTVGWTFDVDNIQVGARNIVQGAAISDWMAWDFSVAYAGTITSKDGRWRREGNSFHGKIQYVAGTVTNINFISLPNNWTVDIAQLPRRTGTDDYPVGGGIEFLGSPGAQSIAVGVFVTGTQDLNQIKISHVSGGGAYGGGTGAVGDNSMVTLDFVVPIAQWAGSGTVGLVQNYEEYASNSDVSTTAVVTGSGFLQGFGNWGGFGSGWAIDTSWGRRVRFAYPYSQGRDTISVGLRQISTGYVWDIIENSGSVCSYSNANTRYYGYFWKPVADDPYAIDVYFASGGCRNTGTTYGAAGTAFSTLASDYQWFVKKTSAGKPGETLPNIRASYTVGTAQSIGNNAETVINFNAKVKDTDNIVSVGSGWKATFQNACDILIDAGTSYESAAYTISALFLKAKRYNAAGVLQETKKFGMVYTPAATMYPTVRGSVSMSVSGGDYVQLVAYHNFGSAKQIIVEPSESYVNITSIGRS